METSQNNPEDFSISEGGPIYNKLTKLPLFNSQKKLALLGLFMAWLPLIIISAVEGTLFSGVQMPLLYDIAMQARMLIAFPMLILIKNIIDTKVMEVTRYIGNALLYPEERELIINKTIRRARKLTSSRLTEALLLLIVVAATMSLVKGGVYIALKTDATSWMVTVDGSQQTLSYAGYWSVFISIPMFQFFLLRWFWRYIVWSILLFRLSQANLKLLPTHADRSGGLGIIMHAQSAFCLFFVANGIVISGQFTQQILKHPDAFLNIRSMTFGFMAICISILMLPLLFFVKKLIQMKNEGLLRLSLLGAELSQKFEKEWLDDFTSEKTTEEQPVNPSMIFDYGGMYDAVEKVRIIPSTPQAIIGMAVLLFVPFVPILFIHFSVAELIQKFGGMLI